MTKKTAHHIFNHRRTKTEEPPWDGQQKITGGGGGGTSFIFSEILWPILLLTDPRPFISNRNYARTINGSCGKFSNVIVCSPSPVLRDSNTDSEIVGTTFCIRRGQKTCNLRYIPVLTDHTEE